LLYTKGIILSPVRNIERICEDMSADYFQMQHFITESNWDARALMDQIAIDVSKLLPKRKLTGLIIDETGWVKKGDKSVGVGWQYCGNVGKVANSQVAVMACLSNGDFASMIDSRLYLPEDWCNNPERCLEAGIPSEEMVFRTKLDLAKEIIHHQLSNGISFDFVGADGYYGNDVNFASEINKLEYLYMLDIHSDQQIFTERPELLVPERKSNRGRIPQKLQPTLETVSVSQYMKTLVSKDWQKISVRNTAKGKLTGYYHFSQVFVWNKEVDEIETRLLVIRKTFSGKNSIDIKFSFTNANLDQYTHQGIAYMQAQRFFVEHSIKESKQILGLDQYQTRKWMAWQHQVAMNFLVSSFFLKEKLLNYNHLPLISARDIKEMLVHKLYQQMTDDQIMDRIYDRHLLRQRDINASYLKN
jgi:SRSO17 transposase